MPRTHPERSVFARRDRAKTWDVGAADARVVTVRASEASLNSRASTNLSSATQGALLGTAVPLGERTENR